MVILYIRHADDNDKEKTFRDDPKITQTGAEKVIVFTDKLIKKRGLPEIIYVSPFRRAKLTAKYMLKLMKKKYDHYPEIIIDNRLSRFFSPREKLNPSISNRTKEYQVPIYESWDEFKERALDFMKEMESKSEDIWVITHTLIEREVARRYNVDFPKKIPFLFNIKVERKS